MSSLKKFILEQVAKRQLSQEEAKKYLQELTAAGPAREEDIAIIGMAGRFPMAQNADQFWDILRRGINCIRDYPEARHADFEHILRNPHYTEFLIGDALKPEDIPHAHARAGYLDEIDKFDAAFFGIPPAEATFMDPYQRMALEVAWEAIEDGGYGGGQLFGTHTGVYIGKEGTNYSLYRYCSVKDQMQLTGSWESIMASRISYLFNLRGPCLVVDTACSAGLVSIHLAIQAIQNGECETAIAGGINLSVTGEFNTRFQGGMSMDAVESDDGVIRTFDGRANGTVWGEGVAMVMLKPLSRAIADRDPIHAVIKGSAINNDGASNGLTAPNADAQEEVIVKAWQKAGINPESLGYIEAHGTGTVLGDPIEFKGLTSAFRRFTNKRQFCAIGSLKTNMGHLVSASGVTSLFKVVKSLQHREMAPTINFSKPNPYINFLNSPLYVNDSLRAWPEGKEPRRAALSSFGFSHTNCHMVVEEAPEQAVLPNKKKVYCMTLSGQTQAVLLDYVERFRSRCAGDAWNLPDLCYTCNTGRGHLAHRLAVVASTKEELKAQLDACSAVILGQKDHAFVTYRQHKVVSDRKKQREAFEITDKEKKNLSEAASVKIEKFLDGHGEDSSILLEVARHYVEGADVPWTRFYADEPRRRLSLPTYPFQRIRVWADPKITKLSTAVASLHPLVERVIQRTEREVVFESTFRTSTHWVLSDHKIMGNAVVPGTTYLEMARVAAAQAYGWETMELRDVFFLVPMRVADSEACEVRTRLTRHTDGTLGFDIESLDSSDGSWTRHVEGRIHSLADAPGADLDLAALKSKATETVEEYQGESDTGVFQFGQHWDVVRSAWRIGEDALARLVLPEPLKQEASIYRIHPSVLDNAVNLTSQSTGATFLPFTYKSYRVFAPFADQMYSLIIPKNHKPGAETLTYDVILTDAQGKVLGEIRDYVAKKVRDLHFEAPPTGADGEYLSMRWIPLETTQETTIPEGSLVVLGSEPTEAYQELLAGLASDKRVIRFAQLSLHPQAGCVQATEEGLAAFASSDVMRDVAGLIFASDAHGSYATSDLMDEATFQQNRRLGVDALFLLTKALLNAKVKLPFGLVVLTRNAHRVDGQEPWINPLGAATAALGTVIGMEYNTLPCRLLDLGTDTKVGHFARILSSAQPGKITALRGNATFVREMGSLRLTAAEPLSLRDDGAYVITGGVGGLGLALAGFLAERAKVNLVLLDRVALPEPAQWREQAEDPATASRCAKLAELQDRGCGLLYQQVDVTKGEAVVEALTKIKARFGNVRGVFHLAGRAGDGFLMRKDFATFDEVLRPKVEGTRNLFAAMTAEPLDFFVLFSSITALMGGEGQGDYAAANAFMDAMADVGHIHGRRILAINWPSWRSVGMAKDFGIRDEDTPFTPLAPEDAFARLERILGHELTQILPSSPNLSLIAQFKDALPFFLSADMERRMTKGKAGANPTGQGEGEIQVQVRGKSEEDLTETEWKLAKIYAAVLGFSEIDIFTSFQDMGGNSIIATHLLKVIEEHFPDTVDISDVFSYPSIDEMAAYIDQKRGVTPRVSQPDADAPNWEKAIDQLLEGDQSIDALLERV